MDHSFTIKATNQLTHKVGSVGRECEWCNLDLDGVAESRCLCTVINLTSTHLTNDLIQIPVGQPQRVSVDISHVNPLVFYHEFVTLFVTNESSSFLIRSGLCVVLVVLQTLWIMHMNYT